MIDTQVTLEARSYLTGAYDGILSTHSVELPGYPFGSVMPYCLDRGGRPIILIADIAQHTKNIRANPKVSLILLDRSADDLQTHGRLTVVADAVPLANEEIADGERYYRFFPDARDYHQTHGFYFFRLEPVRLRYIGGFGRIHWFDPAAVIRPNPFTEEQERSMVEHMNADHPDAMRTYCRQAGIPLDPETGVAMAGIDGEGFNLRLDRRLYRIAFPQAVATASEVRAALVAMAGGKSASH